MRLHKTLALGLALAALLWGCAPSPGRLDAPPVRVSSLGTTGTWAADRLSDAPDSLREPLEQQFGNRLGRSHVDPDSLAVEIKGDVTDADLAKILLTYREVVPDPKTYVVVAANPDNKWTYRSVTWTPANGRLNGVNGTEARILFEHQEVDGAIVLPDIAIPAAPTARAAGSVNEAQLRRISRGKTVNWIEQK